jgi:outer membrane protein OmpA-like peptidoglycan-associated protein
MRPGTVALTVTVSDGRGGVTRGRVTVTVTGPDTRNASFEDVHFDFDRSTLRPEATQALDAAIALMKADPALQLLIEGNTCNIGTSEYNLALGERRARAVFDYLVAHGVEAGRLSTVSYGEDRPKVDNATPANRSLNRRAALVVRLR